MKNTEIEYQLSTDYERLYNLLKEGKKVVGFYAVMHEDGRNPDYSRLESFEYSETHNIFFVGVNIRESDFITKDEILDCMKTLNVRYFPLPESQTVEADEPENCTKEHSEGICNGCEFKKSKKVGHPGGSSFHGTDMFWCDWGHWKDDF